MLPIRFLLLAWLPMPCLCLDLADTPGRSSEAKAITREIAFATHDGHAMRGKLTLPESGNLKAIVIYVQTAEGMTVDMKRPLGGGKSFNYFDLYRDRLPAMNVGFFSYEGRGIRNGSKPPRFEEIDWDIYNTSTLDNKVRDVVTAIDTVRKQPEIGRARIFLMGTSEGTLLAAEAASRKSAGIDALILYGVMSDNMRATFRFIVSDGGFLAYRGFFDTNEDGKISKSEFEADPKKYREHVFKNAGFEVFDKDADGDFTAEDMKILSRSYLDAADNDHYELLDRWAKTAAGVATPVNWFKDHFNHPPIWTFLSKLEMPVGFFHGTADTATSVEGVRKLEKMGSQAKKEKMSFHYFDGLDHTLNISQYFTRGTLPAGHEAIFEYIREQSTGVKN